MAASETQPTPRRKRLRRWIAIALVTGIALLIAIELFARFGLGLGDPPLMMRDDTIEYLAQPSATYHRFGNRIAYNQWSMRSDNFPANKTNPNEYRILVLGDSVINGGAQTDQHNLATEIIKRELSATLNPPRPVTVGNISAGSWGPPNLLAYIKKFGSFDADVVVLVLSSHDAFDVPTFGELDVNSPERKPILALQEAVQRYLPRYLPDWAGGSSAKPQAKPSAEQEAADRNTSLAALRELIRLVQLSGSKLLIVQHAEQTEAPPNSPQPGFALVRGIADELSVDCIQLGPAFAKSLHAGHNPYRDAIHPNDTGQRLIADAILDALGEE